MWGRGVTAEESIFTLPYHTLPLQCLGGQDTGGEPESHPSSHAHRPHLIKRLSVAAPKATSFLA